MMNCQMMQGGNCVPSGTSECYNCELPGSSSGASSSGATLNTSCEGATAIATLGNSFMGSTDMAEPSRWYKYTPAQNVTVSINTCTNTNYAHDLILLQGCNGPQIASGSENCNSFGADLGTQTLSAGITYYIKILGYGSHGTYQLDIN